MTLVLPFLLFYAIVVCSGLAALPWVDASLRPWHHEKPFVLRTMLALALGTAAFLVFFSLVARVVPDYRWALPVSLSLLLGVGFVVRGKRAAPFGLRKADIVCSLAFVAVHVALWVLRWHFSDIHFEPGRFGAEKLFNLSLQQSFFAGSGFPPESLWLAGEKEAYYILPRALPGVVAFFAKIFGSGRAVAGDVFHLSDTFFHVLALAVSVSGVVFFTGLRHSLGKMGWILGIVAGLLPFLSTPLRAVSQTFSGNLDLWSLSRIIPNTINEYPFWNYLWADNHAHSNAAFLDVGLLFFTLLFFRAPLKPPRPFLGVAVGVLASSVYMANSGSVIILLCILLPMGALWSWNLLFREHDGVSRPGRKRLSDVVDALAVPLAVALLTALPDLSTRPQPRVEWRLVPPRLASDLGSYLSVFGVYGVAFVVALMGLLAAMPPESRGNARRGGMLLGTVALAAAAAALGYPVVGLALVLCVAAAWPLHEDALAAAALTGLGLTIALPEIVAANFNMGEDLIRFNTVFKFVYDAFYLWPLLLAFVWSGLPRPTARWRRSLAVVAMGGALSLSFFQFKTWEHRLARQRNELDPSGLAFFANERPTDARIADFVFALPGRVVLAEECGMPPKPASYSVAGRISAYSGRPAVCGWAMHSYLHHNAFWTGARKGQPVWPHFLRLNEELGAVFGVGSGDDPEALDAARQGVAFLRAQGVTHLIFGEWEASLHSETSLEALSRVVGPVVFRDGALGVLALNR